MVVGEGPLRFQRRVHREEGSRDMYPVWHRAYRDYRDGVPYPRYRAVCGYVIENPWRLDIFMSREDIPVGGNICKTCERRAAKALSNERDTE